MITYKVKHNRYIINLYLPDKISGKVVLMLPGLPISTNIDKLLNIFLSEGCIVMCPYLAGSFDSGGRFDGFQHIKDVKDLVSFSKKTYVTELYFKKKIFLGNSNKVVLCGMSYGAIIALMGSSSGVEKNLLLSPVFLLNQSDISQIVKFDFSKQMKSLVSLLKNAFPFSYRPISYASLSKFLLGRDKSLRKKSIIDRINSLKVKTLVIHGLKDNSVPYQISDYIKKYCVNEKVEWFFPNVGHSNSSYDEKTLNKIKAFIQ